MHIFLAGHGFVSSKGSRVSSFGAHRFLFLVEKGATFDRTLFNVIVQRILSKKTVAEIEAEINVLIALPSSTLVSTQNRPTHNVPPVLTALEAMTHPQRQALMRKLEELDIESCESRLSWELLEHKITPAPDALGHNRILKINYLGYETRDMIHRQYLSGDRFTLNVGFDLNKIRRDVDAMHSSNQTHGIVNNDHVFFIRPTVRIKTDQSLSFTLLMEVLETPNLRFLPTDSQKES